MVEHPVDAGRGRQRRPEAADDLRAGPDVAGLEIEIDLRRLVGGEAGFGIVPLGVAAVVEGVGGQV